ncbi:MAG: VWA domain-containing protein, partial [Thermoleophilia bacterium]|nr:VWA domain-containing protein [Thermoleophilia bacterium]
MGTESCKDAFLSDGSSEFDCTATKAVSNATPADANKASKGPVRHFRLPTLRSIRSFLLALALIMTLGAATAASASATGDLVVTKGGDRTATNNAQGDPSYADAVDGALFEYTTDNTLPQTGWTDFSAVTDANGQATESLSADTYFVREKTAGTEFTNFGPVQTLSYNNPQPYVARVTVVDGQTTFAYPHTNNLELDPNFWTPNNTGNGPIGEARNNGSPFLNVRDNGTAPAVCGINILLVLDRSASITPYEASYRAAAKAFVDNLTGTPTQIGIISFASDVDSYTGGVSPLSHSPLELTTTNALTLNGTIDNIYNSTGTSTNWDGALNAASQAKGFTPDAITGQTANPDQVVFITDGNPTIDDVTDTNEQLIELTSGMASANKVKSESGRGTNKLKMLAIGVDNEAGSAPTAANLKVVSGPVEGVEGDYATPTITQLNSFLAELAATECGARVFVRKHLSTDPTNQPDWSYTATDPRPGQTPTYLDDDNSTHDNGGVVETGAFFQALPTTPTLVNVNEDATGQPLAAGTFDLTDVDCRSGSYDGTPFPGGVQSGLNFSLPVSRGDEVYCTYTNSQETRLNVRKAPENQTINAGDKAEFTIDVDNVGNITAFNATLSDQLPAPGATPWTVSQQPDNGSCSVDPSNLLTCDFGNILADDGEKIKVETTTSFAECDVYDNPI